MPPSPKKAKRPRGRPRAPIDWAYVDQLILSGCNGAQIAGALDMHPISFYKRFEEEKNEIFTNYQPIREKGGQAIILHKQMSVAKNGNVQMLMFLGKERCGQGRKLEIDDPESIAQLEILLLQLKMQQEKKTAERLNKKMDADDKEASDVQEA